MNASQRSGAAREGRLANVCGALLTGGASTRMGTDKASIRVGGVSFAGRVATTLARLCDEVLIVGGDPPEDAPGRRVEDPGPADTPRCALRGVVAALEAASAERVLIVATDLPLVTTEVLAALLAFPEADAVAIRHEGRSQPLCAVYRREVALAAAGERLAAGPGSWQLEGLLDALDADYFEGALLAALDPQGRALTHVNTPDELEALEGLLASEAR